MRLQIVLLLSSLALISIETIGQTRHLTLESNHSTIGFEVLIAGGATKVTGKFMEADLKLTYVDDDWRKSKVNFTIQVSSINTGIPGRDEHLRSADFFDVETYPHITFISSSIEKVDDSHFVAIGDFTMHGITKSIELPFRETHNEKNTIGVHIESSINRIDHQVGHNFVHTDIPDFLSENIIVKIDFWTKRDKRLD